MTFNVEVKGNVSVTVDRFDKSGKTCRNIGGVMDYGQKLYTGWSTCSNEDFTKLYNKRAPGCLLAEGEAPPPCTNDWGYCDQYKDQICQNPGFAGYWATCRKACGFCN